MDIVRSPEYNDYFTWEDCGNENVIPYKDVEARFFVRITADKKDKVKEIFGECEIIKGVSDYGFVTKKMSVADLENGIEALGGIVSRIRLFK